MEWLTLDGTVRASGRSDVYLIITDPRHLRAYLTRFRTEFADGAGRRWAVDAFDVAGQAARNRIETFQHRGPGRPPGAVEMDLMVAKLAAMAEAYEDGAALSGHPGWERPAPVPVPALADDDAGPQAEAADRRARLAQALAEVGAGLDEAGFSRLLADVRSPGPWVAPAETGEPFRGAAEREWDASRGD